MRRCRRLHAARPTTAVALIAAGLVATSNGDIWNMNPVFTSGAPPWTFELIGNC